MSFFDRFGRSVQPSSRSTLQKNREMAGIARLNSQMAENSRRMSQLFGEIGERYCRSHAHDPEPALAELVRAVEQMRAQNEALEAQIQDLRGLTKCPHCGTVIPKNAAFCSSCGKRVLSEDMQVCLKCGAVSSRSMLYCSLCGTRMPTEERPRPVLVRTCSRCGAQLEPGAPFCSVCGQRADEGPEEQASVYSVPLQPTPAAEEGAQGAENAFPAGEAV